MTINVYIATSLDGYIATVDGGLEWLDEIPNPDQNDYGFADFIDRMDALVMGRNTFEKVVSFDVWLYNKPVFVLSNSLQTLPEGYEEKARLVTGTVMKKLVDQLRDEGFENLYIDGGQVIQSFLEEDLVDRLIITQVPILLGDGIPLFGTLSKRLKFSLDKTERLGELLVMNTYSRLRE